MTTVTTPARAPTTAPAIPAGTPTSNTANQAVAAYARKPRIRPTRAPEKANHDCANDCEAPDDGHGHELRARADVMASVCGYEQRFAQSHSWAA